MNHAELSPDGLKALAACDDGVLQVWDLETCQPAQPLNHEQPLMHACFSPTEADRHRKRGRNRLGLGTDNRSTGVIGVAWINP